MKHKKQQKKRTCGDICLLLVIVAALGAVLYAGGRLCGFWQEYRSGEAEYEELQKYVQSNPAETETAEENRTAASQADTAGLHADAAAPVTVDFEKLKKINDDIVAWLYAEAIPQISYPVVQGTDNTYYLEHTTEKKKNSSASIFLDYRNSASFTDQMTVIYGHNMKNKSMFGRLKQYQKEDTYSKSPYIWILTPEKVLKYEIFSVRTVQEKDPLYSLTADGGDGQKAYMESMQKKSVVPTSAVFDGNEPILTLSTCTKKLTQRCVVQAVLKEQ